MRCSPHIFTKNEFKILVKIRNSFFVETYRVQLMNEESVAFIYFLFLFDTYFLKLAQFLLAYQIRK